jgi:hypothetical protein
VRKEGKPHGNHPPPPQSTLYQKKRKTSARQLCPSLQVIAQPMEFFLSESLGEDVGSLLNEREVLQIDDPIINQLSDKMHMDLNMFCSMSMYCIST